MRNVHRKVVLVAVLVALFFVTGCGKGGSGDDPKEPSNQWDEMNWDKGEWGAVGTRSYRILIS